MSKNTSSKGKAKPGSKPLGAPRSRNTTPLPNVRTSVEPLSSNAYFRANLGALSKKCDVTIEDILDRPGGSSQSAQPVPSSTLLISMREAIESKVLGNVQKRCDVSNSALRELQGLKKNRPSEREKERAADKDADERERKHKLKRIKKAAAEDERPLAVGAHGVARQDGVDLHKGKPPVRFTVFFAVHTLLAILLSHLNIEHPRELVSSLCLPAGKSYILNSGF
jgi:transcriptional adapter 3